MISKELLSEVRGVEVSTVIIDNNIIDYTKESRRGKIRAHNPINIHELAHKCKEWATHKGYEIVESAFGIKVKYCISMEQSEQEQINQEFFSPEYTFKVCQWILDNELKASV